MTTPLEIVLINLEKMGFFAFLPFILTAAIFYGLLRRSKLFGEPEKNVVVNAVISLVAAFMVWAYPILTGTTIEEYQKFFSIFFFKGTVATISVVIGLIVASMFLPEGFSASLKEKAGGRFIAGIILFGLLIGIGTLVSTGITSISGIPVESLDQELIYSIIFLLVFIGILGAVIWLTSREERKR